MTEWEPATDAEVAMRDALRTNDQESYFRILAGVDLLLPVSADALAGLAPLGWGTWSTGGRTHVLAFTSPSALQACLADYTGSARRIAYAELANTWPNLEWWLAVNPGLPIEGYLPAWFVAQLARGDLRLPPRGPNRTDRDDSSRTAARQPGGDAAPGGAQAPHQGGAQAPEHSPAPDHSAAPEHSAVPDHRPASEPVRAPEPVPAADRAGALPPDGSAPAQRPAAVPAGDSAAGGQPGARPPMRTTQGGLPMRTPGVAAADLSARHASLSAPMAPSGPQAAPPVAPTSAVPAAYRPPAAVPTEPPGQQSAAGLPSRFGGLQGSSGSVSPAGPSPTGGGSAAGERPLFAGSQTTAGPSPDVPTPGGPLPRRPVTPASQRPTSMAAAAQAIAQTRAPQAVPDAAPAPAPAQQAAPVQQAARVQQAAAAPAPPVIPGTSAGRDQLPTRTPAGPSAPAFGPPVQQRAAFGPRTGGFGPPVARPEPAPPAPPAAPVSDPDDDFQPANEVEQNLYAAADGVRTDVFLSTLLLATVLVPVGAGSRPGAQPGDPGFVYRTEDHDGDRQLIVFTSSARLADHYPEPVRTIGVRFLHLISHWPDREWVFSVNPGSPVGAKLPGAQIVALASWATEVGLGVDGDPAREATAGAPAVVPAPAPRPTGDSGTRQTIMQKTLPPEQVDYFLDRGYDRVSGFVHRADEVAHLRTPADLHAALGLGYAGSPHQGDAKEAFVLRWAAYRPSLYRIPYGGQTEQAARAMDGWVIERAPFRGNGFAPGESRDVIAEFKVDSARLPHGSQLWRIDADGEERMIAILDCDASTWRRVGER